MRSVKKMPNDQLPLKLEKAAITIQRYYRFRMFMKRTVYQKYID